MKRTHSLTKGLATLVSGLALALLVATAAQAVTTSGNVISTNAATGLVTIQTDGGQRVSVQSSDATTFLHEGATMKLDDLQPGARITVTSAEPATLGGSLAATHVEIDQMTAPVVVAAAEYPEPSQADRLPSTATPLPFVALAGSVSILAGLGLRLRRRQA